jgi:zinc transport system ATP-binding protein
MSAVLQVSDVSVTFGQTRILTNLSFDVPAGASLAIIGPNGAGKTVLLRALTGAVPHAGDVRWAPGVRLGYVPQKLDVDRDVPITGRDFLAARLALSRIRAAPVREVLAMVGLHAAAAHQPIGELSGGQFQRLLMAFALLGDPTVLLLDEPTASVDEPGQERLNDLIHRLQHERGLTVILVSHELSVVHRYATLVLCLNRDHAWIGPPYELTPDALREAYGAPLAIHGHDH